MKNTLIIVFALATAVLAAACIWQMRQSAERKAELTRLRTATEQQTREYADLESVQKLTEQQRHESLVQASDLAQQLQAKRELEAKAAQRSSAGSTAATTESVEKKTGQSAYGSFLAKMMEDPDTKKMIRDQQRMMLDQLYNPLIKQLKLAPEEAAQFKDLLADNMIKAAEKATSLMGDSATNRTEALKQLAEEQKGFEGQVREFLGEVRYAQYKDYQETVGERTQLSQFRQQSADGEAPITDAQSEQLLALMKEEKKSLASLTGQPPAGEGQDPANMQAMLAGEGAEKLLQSQEVVNQRVYERARAVLSENQLGAFGKFQTNQLQMMRMGLTMAKKFMSPEQPAPESPALPRP